jgi:hypothetical protein
MAHFTTAAKRYREGTPFDSFGGLDDLVTAGHSITQTAPKTLPEDDGVTERKFLFWDTGRQITNKRSVRWTFNHPDQWTSWNAVAWYGIPPQNGNGGHTISLDAYWVTNGTLDATPVDQPDSTFVDGGGAGQTAWPDGGNDHAVDTEWGAGDVYMLPHMQRTVHDPVLDFSSIQQLVWGGDDSSVFDENDDNVTTTTGIFGVFLGAHDWPYTQGGSAVLMVGYAEPAHQQVKVPWWELVEEATLVSLIDQIADPSPEDVARLKQLAAALNIGVASGTPQPDMFEGLVAASKTMSRGELKRAIASTKATLERGQAALKTMETLEAKAAR